MPEFILTKNCFCDGVKMSVIEKYCQKCLEQRDINIKREEEIKSKIQIVDSSQ